MTQWVKSVVWFVVTLGLAFLLYVLAEGFVR